MSQAEFYNGKQFDNTVYLLIVYDLVVDVQNLQLMIDNDHHSYVYNEYTNWQDLDQNSSMVLAREEDQSQLKFVPLIDLVQQQQE